MHQKQNWQSPKNWQLTLWNLWLDIPPHREIFIRSQCKKNIASPENKTGRTKSGSTTARTTWSTSEHPDIVLIFNLKYYSFRSLTASDTPETTNLNTLPLIPKFVWQQPPATSVYTPKLVDTHGVINSYTIQNTHRLEPTQICVVAKQTSPRKDPQL